MKKRNIFFLICILYITKSIYIPNKYVWIYEPDNKYFYDIVTKFSDNTWEFIKTKIDMVENDFEYKSEVRFGLFSFKADNRESMLEELQDIVSYVETTNLHNKNFPQDLPKGEYSKLIQRCIIFAFGNYYTTSKCEGEFVYFYIKINGEYLDVKAYRLPNIGVVNDQVNCDKKKKKVLYFDIHDNPLNYYPLFTDITSI